MLNGRYAWIVLAAFLAACASDTGLVIEPDQRPASTATAEPVELPVETEPAPTARAATTNNVDSPVADDENEAGVTDENEAGIATETDAARTVETVDVTATGSEATEVGGTSQPCARLTDFGTDAEVQSWFVVNDNVMGGRSSGGPTFADSVMIFEGVINTNGGGFSSVRMQLDFDVLAGLTHLRMRARTDGRPYKVILEDNLATRDRRVSQQGALNFAATSDWQTVELAFAALQPMIFGRSVQTEAFRPDLATQLGVMISDSVDGPFRVEIDWIDACASP